MPWGHSVGVGATARWICYYRDAESEETEPLFVDEFAHRFGGREVTERLLSPWQHFFYLGTKDEMADELKAKYLVPCLGRKYYAAFKDAPADEIRLESTIRNFGMGMRKRTFIIDHEVEGAITAGVKQVVLLANGFDLRCMRLLSANQCTWWLIDQPDVIDELLAKVPELNQLSNVHYIRVRFGMENWTESLISAGYDLNARTFALAEGLVMYLKEADALRLVADVASLLSIGSYFMHDFINAGMIKQIMFRPLTDALDTLGAPWTFGPRNSAEWKNILSKHRLELLTNVAASDPSGKADMFDWCFPHFPQHRLCLSVKCAQRGILPESHTARPSAIVKLPAMRPATIFRHASKLPQQLLV